MSLADLRKEYTLGGVAEADLDADPIRQFQKWFAQAQEAGVPEPNAMVLATADARGKPSARVVLLKDVDARGFSFYTNYQSRKGRELAANPFGALNFFWTALERQVCVSGGVIKLSAEESVAYFQTRPRGSRLGAWVSQQSQPVTNRAALEEKLAQMETQHPGEDIPLPPQWGGYLLAPAEIEFWQGRPNRLHDRLRYRKQPGNRWIIERLSP